MNKKLVIFGTGDFAEVAHFYLTKDSPHEIAAFTVDGQLIKEDSFCGLPVLPFETVEKQFPPESCNMFIAVAYSKLNKVRAEKYFSARGKGYDLISYVNSKATTWGKLNMGDNCFILENNVIQPFISIGNNVIIWSGNHLGHHCSIGDHCFIASHVVISGRVKIEPYCFIGVNVSIRDGITIGQECIIGAGSTLVKSTQAKGVYMGKAADLHLDDSSRVKL